MNDFEYDCYQKKMIARSASKRVGQRKGCTLPSDYLTEAEKQALNGEVEIMNPELCKPIGYSYFKMLSKEQQERYLNWLIVTYQATQKDIAEMMGVSKGSLSVHIRKRNLDIPSRHGHSMPEVVKPEWHKFCISRFSADISECYEEGDVVRFPNGELHRCIGASDETAVETEKDILIPMVEVPESDPTPEKPVEISKKHLDDKRMFYAYHLEFSKPEEWRDIFAMLLGMPLPKNGKVVIDVVSEDEKKRNPVGFADDSDSRNSNLD